MTSRWIGSVWTPPADREPLRVLFLGNSMTAANAMPQRFERQVRAAFPGRDVRVEAHAPDGESLAGHLASGALAARLAAGRWDYVVLQESTLASTWILDGAVQYDPPDTLVRDASAAAALVDAAGAVPVLYETWTPSAPREAFAYVDHAAVEAVRASGAILAPVGRVWMALDDDDLPMTAPDRMHPTVAASHAAALTLAVAMLGENALRAAPADDSHNNAVADSAALAPPPATEAGRILSAVRAHAGTSRPDAVATGPEPVYPRRPQPPVADVAPGGLLDGGLLDGVWRARRGGTRLSHGTEVRIARNSDGCTAEVREFTASGIVSPAVEVIRCDGASLELAFESGAVAFRWMGALRDGGLSVLTVQGTSQTREEYRTARYLRDGDAAHFAALDALYARLVRDEAALGLPKALRGHYACLVDTLGRDEVLEDRQGFELNEWDLILAAWHYAGVRDPDRALTFYAAGTALYPTSVDAHAAHAEGLGKLGRRREAANAYDLVLAHLPAGDPRHAAFAAKLRALDP